MEKLELYLLSPRKNEHIRLMVQESGQPVDMENVPLFTRFYKSSGFCLFALPTSGIHLF